MGITNFWLCRLELIIGRSPAPTLQFNLLETIRLHQGKDSFLHKGVTFGGKNKEVRTSINGIIYFKEKICVSDWNFFKD